MINILDKNTKLILAEPIDEAIEEVETEVVDTPSEDEILPDVTLDEPATISTETEPKISSEVKDNNEVSSYIDSEFETPQNNSGMNTQTNNNRNTNSSHIDSNHHSDNEHHEDNHH